MLEGAAKKVSFVLAFLSSVGWVVFCVGFGIRNEWLTSAHGDSVVHSGYFCHWCLAVAAVCLYFLTFIHLLCGNRITGALTLLLAPVVLVTGGGVLQIDGDYLYQYYHDDSVEFEDHVPVEFAGALTALVFYWGILILWVFFSERNSSSRATYAPINNY